MFGATSSLRTRKEVEFIDNNLYWKENKMESEAEVSYMYGEIQELESNIDYEIDRTMGTLECTNLPEDVRAEFLYHLSCLLEKVRDKL